MAIVFLLTCGENLLCLFLFTRCLMPDIPFDPVGVSRAREYFYVRLPAGKCTTAASEFSRNLLGHGVHVIRLCSFSEHPLIEVDFDPRTHNVSSLLGRFQHAQVSAQHALRDLDPLSSLYLSEDYFVD